MEMNMKMTGYQLREAIKQQELRRDTASRMYDGSLRRFPDEPEKENPQQVVATYLRAEAAIATLQTAQMRYNLAVRVEVPYEDSVFPDGETTLAFLIKLVGSLARAEKMYRKGVGPKEDRYSYHDDVRQVGQVHAIPTITPAAAVERATEYAKKAGKVRATIAVANATLIDIEGLDPALVE
jgi:hypothetical protein